MSYVMKDYVQVDVYTAGDSTVHIRAQLLCDTVSDLPAATAIAGFTMEAGSTAWIIGEAVWFMLDTGGAWRQQRTADLASIITDISQIRSDIQADENRIDAAEDRITALEAAAALLIDRGAKNLLEMTHADGSITRYGVTCTWSRADGTMTLTGSHAAADSASIFEFYSGNATDQRQIAPGDYHLAGVPSGGSTSTYRATLTSITGAVDTGSGADFTVTSSIYMAYRIFVSGTINFGAGMTFMPIVTPAAYWALTQNIVPYAPTNRDLYLAIQ